MNWRHISKSVKFRGLIDGLIKDYQIGMGLTDWLKIGDRMNKWYSIIIDW